MSASQDPTRRVLLDIHAERVTQNAVWGEQNHPDGTGLAYSVSARDGADRARRECKAAAAAGRVTWRHIAEEEVREAFAEDDPEKLRIELIQAAAVFTAWAEAIDRRITSER